jgi:hypothetical protein
MLTIRCTQRLLSRLGIKPDPNPPPSSTKLGDWYANLLYTPRGQFILCTSERSLLPVIVTAKDARLLLPAKLTLALGTLLTNLGVSFETIRPELSEMEPVTYAKTASRVVLGMMNDFAFNAGDDIASGYDPAEANRRIAEMPCSPIGMGFPIDVARSLLIGGERN